MLSRFIQHFSGTGPGPVIVVGPSQTIVVGPTELIVVGPSTGILVQPTATFQVQPPLRGAWQEKGWTRERRVGGVTYRGQYIALDRQTRQVQRFQGRIEVANHDIIAFVADPPVGLKSHPKSPCFSLVSQGWFHVHWYRPPDNVDDAILYVERVLDEVLNRRLL